MKPERTAQGIARHKAEDAPLGFEALRSEGLALAQALSGELWTDFHAHDPGVTLLETFCYALTEAVYGAEFPVSDLLGGVEGRIELERHGLVPALDCLPTRPITREDYQRWILDQVPALDQLSLSMLPGASGIPDGLWQMQLQGSPLDGDRSGNLALAARHAYEGQRNLCEDLAGVPSLLAARPCHLTVALTVSGDRDLVELLTELIQRCAYLINGQAARLSVPDYLKDGFDRGLSPAELLEGPPNRHGWIKASDLAAEADGALLFFSDLARELKGIVGIETIHFLGLEAPELEARGGGLPWKGPGWALQLHWPQAPADLARITVFQDGAPVSLPVETLLSCLQDRAARAKPARVDASDLSAWADFPLAPPAARGLAELPFRPAQLDLPPLYRRSELPSEEPEGPAHPVGGAGFQAYLALFEQWLAHAEAQRQHLRDLFSLDPEPQRSYWWQMLGEAHLPGIEALFLDGRTGEQIQAEVFESVDPVLERRARVLDFLLGLHGVSFEQKALRPFSSYFSPADWERHLFEQKRQLLKAIVPLTRDRAGAIDTSRPSMDAPDNTSALQQRVSLQLGFKQHLSRSLAWVFSDLGLELGTLEDEAPSRLSASVSPHPSWQTPLIPEPSPALASTGGTLAELLGILSQTRVHPAFWRCAVQADHYWFVPNNQGQQLLLLGPDEQGHWWQLADRRELVPEDGKIPPLFRGLAKGMRDLARQVHLDGEGLHLVEHLLLRPVKAGAGPEGGAAAAGEVPPEFYLHRLTVLFPAWTARCANPAFRSLAESTLREHLPAHLLADFLWLEAPDFTSFEGLYQTWLEARIAWHADPGDAEMEGWLDLVSQNVRDWLWRQLTAASKGEVART